MDTDYVSRLMVVSCSGQVKAEVNATNTTHEDFTVMNVIQIRLVCYPQYYHSDTLDFNSLYC